MLAAASTDEPSKHMVSDARDAATQAMDPSPAWASPMLVLPVRIEHGFNVAVWRSHDTDARKHGIGAHRTPASDDSRRAAVADGGLDARPSFNRRLIIRFA
jgi:hypothetical protein